MAKREWVMAYAVTDGETFYGGHDHARVWPTAAEAEAAMHDMSWHPKRHAGPWRVVPVFAEYAYGALSGVRPAWPPHAQPPTPVY